MFPTSFSLYELVHARRRIPCAVPYTFCVSLPSVFYRRTQNATPPALRARAPPPSASCTVSPWLNIPICSAVAEDEDSPIYYSYGEYCDLGRGLSPTANKEVSCLPTKPRSIQDAQYV